MIKPSVLYIGGSWRSGSTLLAELVSQKRGWSSVGETFHFPDRGLVQNRVSGCVQKFAECNFWGQVISILGLKKADGARLAVLRNRSAKTKHLVGVLALRNVSRFDNREYLDFLSHLFAAMTAVTKATVMVDSSKYPGYAATISGVTDVALVHLVRDPRAVAYSWGRPKLGRSDPSGEMPRHSATRATAMWLAYNALTELVVKNFDFPSTQIRYEDFVADPPYFLRRIENLVSTSQNRHTIGGRTDEMRSHSLSGNPNRLDQDEPRIVLDSDWRGVGSNRNANIIAMATAPLLLR